MWICTLDVFRRSPHTCTIRIQTSPAEISVYTWRMFDQDLRLLSIFLKKYLNTSKKNPYSMLEKRTCIIVTYIFRFCLAALNQ